MRDSADFAPRLNVKFWDLMVAVVVVVVQPSPLEQLCLIRKSHQKMLLKRIHRIFARDHEHADGAPCRVFVPQAHDGPYHRHYSNLVASCSLDGSPTNRLQLSCIHGTYFTHCAWRRASPTPPGGPSEGHGFDGGAGAVLGSWNPEVANIFDAAARYRWVTVGSSHDDAHPDNSRLHTGKIYSFPLRISRVALLLLRQRRGAAGTT
jgi:hypothetical protein